MATLDATIGGANSNSYITQANATDYFNSRLNSDGWTNASSSDKDAALITAAYDIDSAFVWVGERATDTQRMDWPRSFIDDYDNDEIPFDIQRAQIELALSYLNNGYPSGQKESVNSVKLGSLEVDMNNGSSDKLIPSHVVTILSEFGVYSESSPNSARMVALSR